MVDGSAEHEDDDGFASVRPFIGPILACAVLVALPWLIRYLYR